MGRFPLTNENSIQNLPVIMIAAGGHAKVLTGTLLVLCRQVLGCVELNPLISPPFGLANLGDDRAVLAYAPEEVRLVNGVGSVNSTARRQRTYENFVERGYLFETVIHPSAAISPGVEIGRGAQIMAGAIIQPGSRLGVNVIINTGACVDHDCLIEAHAHIAPGVTLSGDVHIGVGAHIGAGATVIQGIQVGARSIVGAGAVVIRNVPDGVTVVGVPAISLNRRPASEE